MIIEARTSKTHRGGHPPRGHRELFEAASPSGPEDSQLALLRNCTGASRPPFACLVVIIVAISVFPLKSGRRNIFVGVAASIFIFFCVFCFAANWSGRFGETGWLPPWLGAWFSQSFLRGWRVVF